MKQFHDVRPCRGNIGAGPALRVALAAALIALAGCAPDVNVRGNAVKIENLEKIKPGTQDRSAVQELLGSPTNVATFSNETWYYISQKDHRIAFSKITPITRQVIAISFDQRGRVQEVKKFSLADARKIDPVDRVTPTPGQEFSLLQQLIGNLGRFEQSGEGDGF
ncbi:MAG: outer membrane protein assembly factor BamE [Alphaproteobacteria bacterium]|nr:outer membrane protein assembly factor BamE [Alphaproteobacteria bacterium]